jgi:hypothetical protein
MSKHVERKVAVDDGEVVVFLIGMTFNRPWKIRSWWPVFMGMPKMLRELATTPELGLLTSRTVFGWRGPTVIQYWRSAEQLERFARARDRTHTPAWTAFMKSKAATNGDVGIWHETYVTKPGNRENLYLHVPAMGFAAAAAEYRQTGAGEETAKKRREGQVAPTVSPEVAPEPAADAA